MNPGAGPLELRYTGAAVASTSAMRAVQRLYDSRGGYHDRQAGWFYFDPAHQHFHYRDFAVAALWRADRRGHRLGRSPIRTGRKDGFCLEEMDAYTASAGASRYSYPQACYPTMQPDGTLTQVNGLSRGYLDVYDETLTDQSIEVTGVPDGYYLLAITVDPEHTLELAKSSQLTSWQLIQLCGDKAEPVGRADSCGTRSATAPPQVLAQQWRRVCWTGWCPVAPLLQPWIFPQFHRPA
jgi:hypothetical protein